MAVLLEFKDVNTYYGDLHVLKDVNYTIGEGEIVSLLGGNACGKSTTMKTIMGVVRPTRGSVMFEGQAIERHVDRGTRAPRHRAGAGGAAAVPAHDGVREPGDGRLSAQARRRNSTRIWSGCIRCSRA